MSSVMELQKALEQKGKYPHEIDLAVFYEECSRDKCKDWQFDWSRNHGLVISCVDFYCGFCKRTAKQKLTVLEDIKAELNDFVVVSKAVYDGQVHVPRKQLSDIIVGHCSGYYHCNRNSYDELKKLLEASEKKGK